MDFKLAALPLLMLGAVVPAAASEPQRDRVEVVFALDTTGSMADLIDGAKRKIWSIASTIVDANPDADIAMALVAYRDRGDEYIVQTTPLSEDIQGLYGKLIRLQADGGGDTPESVNEALDKAVSGMQWSSGEHVRRIVFLVGDAPPHMDYAQERQYPAILKQANERKIVVNAVQAGNLEETIPVWKEIAQYGHGRYIAIPQSGGEITVIITPYDDGILELQHALDQSVLPYGNREKQAETGTKMREKAAAPSSVQIDNSKYYSKRSARKEVITGGGDLIADIANKAIELERVKDEELPEVLKGKSKEEIQSWIESKLAERRTLEAQMSALISKRDAFVVSEEEKAAKPDARDSFDKAVENTLKEQLK
jgi:Mg-chelatase subunit ChlD/predicted house-cleaning noncanonical NTP pyrophosphatase (MazG superfamily)